MIEEALRFLQIPPERAAGEELGGAVEEFVAALERFRALLPPGDRPVRAAELLPRVARTNALDALRIERRLPVTVVFLGAALPPGRDVDPGELPWRIAFTDGGEVSDSPLRARLLEEAVRLAEAMHEKNPFAEVPFDGGKTVLLQEQDRFQAVTALHGDPAAPRFILAKGGIRHYAQGVVEEAEKRRALTRWAASSASAGLLGRRYIGGPDMRMGEEEMAWVNAAAGEVWRIRGLRHHPPVTGLVSSGGGFPHAAWELAGRTVVASLEEALLHPACARYDVSRERPVRVILQGFGDVGGSVARLLTEERRAFSFRIVGVADERAALYHAGGLNLRQLLALRSARRSIAEYRGERQAMWAGEPSPADGSRPEFRGRDGGELLLQEADVLIPAAGPDAIDAAVAAGLKVRVLAEGANSAVAPGVEGLLHERGILYLPGQALNWGGVRGSTLEVLFRESTKRTLPYDVVDRRVRQALGPCGGSLDLSWALDLLRSGLTRPPLEEGERRAFVTGVLEDLARINTRWLMGELLAARHSRTPLDVLRDFARTVRTLKVRLLALVEQGLGAEFFAPETSLRRLQCLLADRLKELLGGPDEHAELTVLQIVEQRQLLERVQKEVLIGISPVLAALTAALDLARQKVMDPEGYTPESLRADLATLRDRDAPLPLLEESLHRLQRVHPGAARGEFLQALGSLLGDGKLPPAVRRNAALAMAKLGTADPGHRAILLRLLEDPDASLRACCRWALFQMAIEIPGEG